MSNNKTNFYFIIIVILVIVLLLQKCGGGGKVINQHDTIRTIDTSYVTVTKEIPTYIPKWNTKVKYVHDTTVKIDTAYVVGDYFSTYYYKDSLINDTLCFYINDSISKNKIKSRKLNYVLSLPTINTHDVVIQKKNEFYIGLGLVGSKTGISFFGPELLLRTKSQNVYGVGVGLDGSLQPNLSLRTYWKIGKK